jgi:hypothetical protein
MSELAGAAGDVASSAPRGNAHQIVIIAAVERERHFGEMASKHPK